MRTATISDFRANMKKNLQTIEDDQDILILHGGQKQQDFVVLTLDEYNSMLETVHLMSTPANAKRLMESIEQAKKGNLITLETTAKPGSDSKKVKTALKKKK